MRIFVILLDSIALILSLRFPAISNPGLRTEVDCDSPL